ncbi:hypothetical protein Tco_1126332, partial [Tanacetum coccineum]
LRSRTQRFQVDAWVKMGNSEIMVKDVDTQMTKQALLVVVFTEALLLGIFKLIRANGSGLGKQWAPLRPNEYVGESNFFQ